MALALAASNPQPANPARAQAETLLSPLVQQIRRAFDSMQRHRTMTGVDDRLDRATRTYAGRYDPEQLQQIRLTRGSEIYVQLTSGKCRGASALLKDIYLGAERPWSVSPTPWPHLPGNIEQAMGSLITAELQVVQAQGDPAQQEQAKAAEQERTAQLRAAAQRAARERAKRDAVTATRKLDDILQEGNFYGALGDFLTDLPIYPYAVIKGPVVETKLDVVWGPDGQATTVNRPLLTWRRVSPYDLWWSPGIERIVDGSTVERVLIPRVRLAAMRDVPGWDVDAINQLLFENDRGTLKKSWFFGYQQNRKDRESRDWDDDPDIFDLMLYHGWQQGSVLLSEGLEPSTVGLPDIQDTGIYFIECWLAADMALRTRVTPWPSPSPPYFVTSYVKTPGSIPGMCLEDILRDPQRLINATARALANNMALASGPQVGVNSDALPPGEDPTAIFPWKVWLLSTMGNQGQVPITFFQPDSRAAELLGVYKELMNQADELSQIPRYMTGSERTGGAARTSSGLAMLMNNAAKGLQQVASNVDVDVIEPVLHRLYDVVMLTDEEGVLRGDEELVARGVAGAQQMETDRVRQLEFLQATANPIDMQIIGVEGRANVLRPVANTIGLDGDSIVPDEDELRLRDAMAGVRGTPVPVGQGPGPIPGVNPPAGPGAPAEAPGSPPAPQGPSGPGPAGGPPQAAPTGRPGPMLNAVQAGGR